jgi:hypothetical protein
VYQNTNVLGLNTFLREKFNRLAGNDSSLEEIWQRYKDILFESIKHFLLRKILSKNPAPAYYNKEVKLLRVKVRTTYNKKKFAQPYEAELKRLFKELLVAKKKVQETFLRSVLQNEDRCWTEIYKYVKGRKRNRENILAIKDHSGKFIKGPAAKANSLNACYASQFSCESNNPQIQLTEPGKPFTISINVIRKRLSAIWRKK